MAETRTQSARERRQVIVTRPYDPKMTDTEAAEITWRPGPGDPKTTEAFGQSFKAGESVKVPGHIVDKAKGNPYFQVAGEESYGDGKPKDEKPVEQPEASFEENLARERADEYLSGKPIFAAAPGEAERVARAQEQAAELKSAQEDEEDVDKKRKRDSPRSGRSS